MNPRASRNFLASFFCLAFSAGLVHAAELKDFAGTWVMRLGERNLFVLTLEPEGTTLRGNWECPKNMSGGNGIFMNMRGGVRRDPVARATLSGNILHVVVQSSGDAKDQTNYSMTLEGDHATLSDDAFPAVVGISPYSFERGAAGAAVATDWEPNRLYTANDSDVSNADMKAIYAEDQRVREAPAIDWIATMKSDAERREKTRKLLADGKLHTGKDYEEAAFIFQHGNEPDDFLLAHTLAMAAVSKGNATAIWIASATLDRYLQKIGQKQVFGTQFSSSGQQPMTQEPYNRDLVPDLLRQQLGVPTQPLQEQQLKAYQSQK